MWEDMENFAGDYAALYQWEYPTPPGRPVPTHVTLFRINQKLFLEAEVEAEFRRLSMNKAGGHTHISTEHFKKCLWEACPY